MSAVQEFARRIARLERDVRVGQVAPQLGSSSLDDESINVYDEDGSTKARVGRQHDGTYTAAELDGPVPPVPSVPVVEGGQASLTVRCDGTYEDDARAPLDFRLFEVYAAQSPFTDRNDAFLLGHFSNEAGGEITVARPVGEWHVGLVTKAETGRRSAVSALAVGESTSIIDQALIDELESNLADLGIDLGVLTDTTLPALRDRIDNLTDVDLPALGGDLAQAQQDIIDAFGAAADAATAASDAQDTANAAAQSAAEAVGLVSGMGTVLFQSATPDTEFENDSTLWVDTTDGLNISKRWDGTEWKIVRDQAVVDAVNKAIAAKDAADAAAIKADNADIKAEGAVIAAGNAQGTADQAITDAGNAQDAANTAAQDASDAAGIASGKGDVLVQSYLPAEKYRTTTTLWIDTTNHENTPKRWVSGLTWEAITDKTATDAADVAANAALLAGQAESDASDAQNRADAAHSLAGTAEGNAQTAITRANDAQDAADKAAKSLFSTSPPSGQAPYGSIWFQVDGSGRVIGQWQQTTPGFRGTWTVRQIRSEIISNLDVGKLTAGTASIASVVAQKIAVSVATIIELNADRIKAGTIDVERLNAAAVAAAVGQFITLSADQITAVGAGFDTAVVNRLFADMFVAHKITAEHADLQSFLADTGWVGDMRTSILTASSVPPDALKLGMDELLPDPMFEQKIIPESLPVFVYSPSFTEGGQADTLAVGGRNITSADRFYLSDSKSATPGQRYTLRAKLRTTQRDYGVALGLEIQDKDGVKIADVVIPSRIDAPLEDPDPDPDPIDPDDPVGPDDDDPFEYPLNTYFTVDGVVVVPAGGFRVRPWIGLQPGDIATTAYWFVSSVSWRDVPSTTDVEGWVTQLTPNGLQVISPEGTDAVQLGNFTVRGLTLYNNETELDEDGEPVLGDDGEPVVNEVPTVSLTDDGYVGAHEVAANESLTYRGVEMQDMLDDLPRGAVAQITFDGSRRGPYAALTGVGYVRFMAEPGRAYKIATTSTVRNSNGTGVTIRVHLNMGYSQFPTPAVAGSVSVDNTIVPSDKYSDTFYSTGVTNTVWTVPDEDDDRPRFINIVLSVGPPAGTGDIDFLRGEITVEDVGTSFESEGGYHRAGTSGAPPSGGTQDPPPPAPKKQTYTRQFNYRWVKSWQGNGATPSEIQSMAYQGRSPRYPAGGVYRSMVGIQSMTSYLSGATVKKVRVRVRMDHSHSNTGGRVVIGTHSWNGKPSSFTNYNWNVVNSWFRRGQTKWVTLPKSTHAGFKNGSRRGIVFYTSSGKSKYYAKMSAAVTAIEVTYEK